jgi:hypothetical protein
MRTHVSRARLQLHSQASFLAPNVGPELRDPALTPKVGISHAELWKSTWEGTMIIQHSCGFSSQGIPQPCMAWSNSLADLLLLLSLHKEDSPSGI